MLLNWQMTIVNRKAKVAQNELVIVTKPLEPEQELKIYKLKLQVEPMTEVEVKSLLVEMFTQMHQQENFYKQQIKKAWIGEDA